MNEKRKNLEGTLKILKESQKEIQKYEVVIDKNKFIVYPNVFSPKYFNDTEFFAKEIPIKKGDEFLEIGCGTGIISVFACWKGAKNVVAVDINPSAVKNTKDNAKLHNLGNKINAVQGDIFNSLKDEKFDVIFWNVPFAFTKNRNPSL